MPYNNNNNNNQRVSVDRFQRPYVLKFAKQVVDKKTGAMVDGTFSTYIEIGKQLYKVEMSKAKKTKEVKGTDYAGVWVKVTKVEQNKTVTNW